MSDWKDVPIQKVTEANIREFAGLENGLVPNGVPENPTVNLAMINQELDNPHLSDVARKILTQEKARWETSSQATSPKWEDVPYSPRSTPGSGKSAGNDSVWKDVPDASKWKSKNDENDDPLAALAGPAEAGLNFVSGIPAALGGGLTYLGALAGTGGDTAAALATKQGTEKRINDAIQYEPRTDQGKIQTEGIGKAMNAVIDAGGQTMPQLVGAIPLIGEDMRKQIDKDNPGSLEAIGKAYTEMMLNVAPIPAFKGAKGDMAKSIVSDAAAKLEALAAREIPTVEPVTAPAESTIAHADDFAAVNPYDVGGHVTASEQGRPSTIDTAQGDLFGSHVLEDAQPVPRVGQESIAHDTIPYQKEFPFGLADRQQKPREMGFNMAEKDSPLSLVPKEEAVPQVHAPEPTNAAMSEAMKRAETEKAYAEVAEKATQQKDTHYQQLEQQAIANRAGELDYLHSKDVLGDKTLMSQDKTIMMRALMRINDLRGSLGIIVDSHPSAIYRDLAKFFQDRVEGLKIELSHEPTMQHGERSVTGLYDPNTHSIKLSGLGATSPHTVLHEISHALTSQFMQARPMDVRVMGLKNLFNKMSERGMQKSFPGIVNAREFVAEAFSNPKFQEYLKQQHYDNRSVYRKFVEGVKNLLGIPPEIRSAFDHAMDLGKQVMDASDAPTRAKMMDQFRGAGMPTKLADLMAGTPHDLPSPEVNRSTNIREVAKNLPGLEHAVSDFAFYDKPVEELIAMAAKGEDIPTGAVEKFSQQMQGGALFQSLKTRNPVVKYTYERITRAFQEASHAVKVNLTDPVTGIKSYMRALSTVEKGEIHAAIMMHEGQKVLSSSELAAAGMSEKQIAYYNRLRELDDNFFQEINEQRVAQGLRPMDKRIAHIAGRFMGDFSRMVYKTGEDGVKKVVGRISGNTRGELNKALKHMEENHPEFTFDKEEYNKLGGKGTKPGDRFTGMMEALNALADTDANVAGFLDSYKGYLQQDAVTFLNATRHAKAKVKEAGGIHGSEGHKEWKGLEENADEGMKAQLSYFEQGYEWMSMNKAQRDLAPLLTDASVVDKMPRAVDYAQQYIAHAQGRNGGPAADLANWTLNMIGEGTGLGHSNILATNAKIKHLMMQKFMGLMNIPFSITQLSQPFQTQPALMGLLRARGLEFHTSVGQAKAAQTFFLHLAQEHGLPEYGKLSDFEKSALKYADEMNIFDVKMAEHTKDINSSVFKDNFDKFADFNIQVPERVTRGMAFLAYAHILKDAGIPMKDIFGASENMTNMSMVNYHKIERPMGYAKLGWLGDVASTLTRYKHNQWSQLAFYGREAMHAENGLRSSVPMAKFLATSIAFGGIMGFFAFQEADAMYQLMSEHLFKKPDSLTNQALKAPEVLAFGVPSVLGVDMTSRFSNANAIPNSIPEALMPYGSGVLDTIASTGRWALDPTNSFKFKQALKGMAPQASQGIMENKLFTEKQKDGSNLYINSTPGPNQGKGRVARSDSEMDLRTVGFRSVRESAELAKNYSDSQIAKQHSNIADGLVSKAKDAILGDTATAAMMRELSTKAAAHGMSPDKFTSELVNWSQDRHLTQKQQILLQNAGRGFKGVFNIKESR